MRTLPYPALLLTRTFEVQAINDRFQQVFEFPQLSSIPGYQRNIIHQKRFCATLTRLASCFRFTSDVFTSRSLITGIPVL